MQFNTNTYFICLYFFSFSSLRFLIFIVCVCTFSGYGVTSCLGNTTLSIHFCISSVRFSCVAAIVSPYYFFFFASIVQLFTVFALRISIWSCKCFFSWTVSTKTRFPAIFCMPNFLLPFSVHSLHFFLRFSYSFRICVSERVLISAFFSSSSFRFRSFIRSFSLCFHAYYIHYTHFPNPFVLFEELFRHSAVPLLNTFFIWNGFNWIEISRLLFGTRFCLNSKFC